MRNIDTEILVMKTEPLYSARYFINKKKIWGEMINLKDKKCLISYYSRKGNNYVGGSIVNLPVGNTEVVAKMIQEITEADSFNIDTVKSYPEDYTETTNVSKKEQEDDARPELSNHLKNLDSYDVIFLGYPNWYGTMPMALFTFLEEYDFSGKTIIPFCTHEGSGMGSSESDIKKICPKSNILEGLPIKGDSADKAGKDISNWLQKLGMVP